MAGRIITMPVPRVRVSSQIELWRHNAKSEKTDLGENGEISSRWLF